MPKRRNLTPAQKVAIVRAHLLDGVLVSEVCDKHQIHATQYYASQKQLFENGEGAFARRKNQSNSQRQQDSQQKKVADLEAKIQSKNEVVAELFS